MRFLSFLAILIFSSNAEGEWVIFSSTDCDDCRILKEEVIPAFEERSGTSAPKTTFIDLDEMHGYETLLAVESALNTSGDAFPAILIGDKLLYGVESAKNYLNANSRKDLFSVPLPESIRKILSKEAESSESFSANSSQKREILYVETSGCRKCARVEKQLAFYQRKFPDISIRRLNSSEDNNRYLQFAICKALNLPVEKRFLTPMLISGKETLFGDSLSDMDIQRFLNEAPANPFWQNWNEQEALSAAEKETDAFSAQITWTAVLAGGLVDGLNPCAFSVILFLAAMLGVGGTGSNKRSLDPHQRKQSIFRLGCCFCAGVFACYFLLGMGMSAALEKIQSSRSLISLLFRVTGVICLLFFIAACVDVAFALKKGAGGMRFGLPASFRNKIHSLIRHNAAGRSASLVSGLILAGIGFVVSSLELVCTGQIYLPVLMLINRTAAVNSILLLAVYNLAFIAPLVLLVYLAAKTAGSTSIAKWMQNHVVIMRAAVGILALLFAILMFYMA